MVWGGMPKKRKTAKRRKKSTSPRRTAAPRRDPPAPAFWPADLPDVRDPVAWEVCFRGTRLGGLLRERVAVALAISLNREVPHSRGAEYTANEVR